MFSMFSVNNVFGATLYIHEEIIIAFSLTLIVVKLVVY